ncbi:MAG TPA: lytic transglycosylase domain-containing protein [Blastocatellia bacterium]
MKPIFTLLALVFLLGVSATAHAQAQSAPAEAADSADNDDVPANVPSMVVREAPTLTKSGSDDQGAPKPGQTKPAKADKQSGAKKEATTATPATGQYTAKPVVFSTQQPGVGIDGTTGSQDYDRMVTESAVRNDVDPNLILAVMNQESGFNPHARSYKGACGLMQLMPDTARRFGVVNIYDPAQNIEGGAKYLRFLLDKFNGDVKLTLAGYNAGEGAVVEAGYKVPHYKETQNYVKNISARYGASPGPALPASGKASKPGAVVMSDGGGSVLSNNY